MTMTMSKKNILSLALLLMCAVAAPGIAGAQTVTSLNGNINMVTSSMNDSALKMNVERALIYNMGTDIFALEVSADNGIVCLSGGVDLPEQISRASNILTSMGVSEVVNNLSLKNELPAYRASLNYIYGD